MPVLAASFHQIGRQCRRFRPLSGIDLTVDALPAAARARLTERACLAGLAAPLAAQRVLTADGMLAETVQEGS